MSDADDCSHQMTAGLAIKELCVYIDTFSSVYVCICAQLMKTLWDRELCSPSEKSQWVLASCDSTRGCWFPHTPSFLLSFNCNTLNDSHLQKTQHSTLVLFYTRKINISLYVYCVLGFLTAQKIGNETNVLKKINIYITAVWSLWCTSEVSVWGAGVHTITLPPQIAVNALHLHAPAREAQSHQYPYFLFPESQTQLHSILPARISKDITNINNLRLWAPPGNSVISTFSRTKHLSNLMCPGQTPETYRRAEKRTWNSRQPNGSQLSCLYAGWCKTRTSCHELNQPPDSWPVRRMLTSSAEPQNHYTWAARFCNWSHWAIISPWREIRGVVFTYLLP